MKKLLALVLALVMSLSLVTISNAAYDDADQISNEEAVAVMSAVGVLQGSGNKFAPKDNLTREQAAKVIAYLALGEDVAEALPAVKVFDDVEADRWSAKYIAYCAQEGIINGVGDGKFDPTSKVTGYAFGKMVLCALGYDAAAEYFTGNGWEIKVAQMMKKLELNDGVSAPASLALTREQAAQYMLNAIQLQPVSYYDGNGGSITIGEIVINNDPGKAVLEADKYFEINYEDLHFTTGHDAFGRVTHVWTLDGQSDAVYDDVVATAKKSYTGKVEAGEIYKDLGLGVATGYTLWTNGTPTAVAATDAAALKKDSKVAIGTVGQAIEVYKDGDAYTIVVIDYDIDKVADVKDAKYNKDGTVKSERKISFKTAAGNYETEKFAKDDYVLVAKVNNVVKDVVLAETVKGEVTGFNKDGKAIIDGTAYVVDGASVEIGDKGTFYLGIDSAIVDTDTTGEKSDKSAYIYSVIKDDKKADGLVDGKTFTAYFVDADGVKGSAVVAEKDALIDKKDADFAPKQAYTYKLNADGELETGVNSDIKGFEKKTAKIDKDVTKVGDYYLSSSTEFVFVKADSKLTTSVATGYKNVNIAAGTEYWVGYDKDSMAVIVFVADEAANVADEAANFLLDADYSTSKNSDKELVYTYDVMIDGEETTLETKDNTLFAALEAGDRFSYESSKGYVTDVTKVNANDSFTVTKVVESFVYGGTEAYEVENDTVIYKLSDVDGYELGAADNGTVADFTVVDSVAKDNVVRVYLDASGDVAYIVIIVKD